MLSLLRNLQGGFLVQAMAKNAQEFIEAVKSGDPVAQCKLGMMYLNGSNGLKQDYLQAFRWFSEAAEMGNSSAMFQLGKLYEQGLGVEADTDEALKWYKSAVDGGNDEAKAYLPKYHAHVPERNTSSDSDSDAETIRTISHLSNAVVTVVIIIFLGGFLIVFGIASGYEVFIALGVIVALALPLWLLHLFFKSLAGIMLLLLDIKNILQNNNDHKGV